MLPPSDPGGLVDILRKQDIEAVFHFAPLHYLPFIARSQQLRTKASLAKAGHRETHFRSMSRRQDATRGFGDVVHLTVHRQPKILLAKLAAGFPHVGLMIPVAALDSVNVELCRYNIAMARQLRKSGTGGFLESSTNGRYYEQRQIPTARTSADQSAMLAKHLPQGTVIEVLVRGDIHLPADTIVLCYAEEDARLSRRVLEDVSSTWSVRRAAAPEGYSRDPRYARQVVEFVDRALADSNWRGDGLEFDRLPVGPR